MVPKGGFEPPRLSAVASKTTMSASSTIWANVVTLTGFEPVLSP